MGIGPVPAIKAALNKADKSLQDMELIEVFILKWIVNCWIFMFYIVILLLAWHKLCCLKPTITYLFHKYFLSIYFMDDLRVVAVHVLMK